MPSADEIWEWIRTPLDELKNDLNAEPAKPWETRRAEFLERLGLTDPNQHPVIEHLFQSLDQLTDDDRDTAITSGQIDTVAYELAQHHAVDQNQSASADGPAYDEQAWQAYLTENGPFWDGTAQSWDQFTPWFLYHAEERGLTEPATTLVDHLTAQPAAERITTLAQYGVVINPAAPQPEAGGPAGADAESIMAELLAEHPDLADIPEDRRREIMAEVVAQVQP